MRCERVAGLGLAGQGRAGNGEQPSWQAVSCSGGPPKQATLAHQSIKQLLVAAPIARGKPKVRAHTHHTSPPLRPNPTPHPTHTYSLLLAPAGAWKTTTSPAAYRPSGAACAACPASSSAPETTGCAGHCRRACHSGVSAATAAAATLQKCPCGLHWLRDAPLPWLSVLRCQLFSAVPPVP